MFALVVGIVALATFVGLVRYRRRRRRAIEVGTVSPAWLAEYKLGKRDSPWD